MYANRKSSTLLKVALWPIYCQPKKYMDTITTYLASILRSSNTVTFVIINLEA